MPSKCNFIFDRDQPIYYSGETINGYIELETTSEKIIKEIYMQFKGNSKVRWKKKTIEEISGQPLSFTAHNKGDETYLNTKVQLCGEGVLHTGTHKYPFSIELPKQCPTSCVEIYGKVYYEMSLVLKRSRRFDNVFKKPFTVIRRLNLNQQPDLSLGQSVEVEKYFGCWPSRSGPVLVNLKIPYTGYAAGQVINCKVEIANHAKSNDLKEGIELKLIQNYKFIANRMDKMAFNELSNELATTSDSLVCSRLTKRAVRKSFTIPALPPSCEDGIIRITYAIEMHVNIGAAKKSIITIPIVIGTAPLMLGTDKPPAYDESEPPTYEEACNITCNLSDSDEADEHNSMEHFTPKYPVYKQNSELEQINNSTIPLTSDIGYR